MVDGSRQYYFFGFEKLSEASRTPNVKISLVVDSATVISSSNQDYILQLSDKRWMEFVDFVPDAELPVFVAAHSKDLALGSQEESVEDSTLNLFDFMAEVYENGCCYFFGPVDSKFSVLV